MIDYKLLPGGALDYADFDGTKITFRHDGYRGFQFLVYSHEREFAVRLCDDLTGEYCGLSFSLDYSVTDDALAVCCRVKNTTDSDFSADRLGVRLGTDCYMEKYPDWNDRFFPTLLRCEKTHFWGYFMSPDGKVLGICSPDPVASWSLDYNRALYGKENHVGHRIYSAVVDLLNKSPQPARHPEGLCVLHAGEEKKVTFFIKLLGSTNEVADFTKRYTSAPFVELKHYTVEIGQKAEVLSDGEIKITAPDGSTLQNGCTVSRAGLYKVEATKNGKCSEASLYVRRPYSFYLEKAAAAALEAPQKASTHAESWYGFFSAFLWLRYHPDEQYKKRLLKEFDRVFSLMYEGDGCTPVPETFPGRIQNHSSMVSLLCDVYEATGDTGYLIKAGKIAKILLDSQSPDGAYRLHGRVHYTCVIYLAKSMLELYDAEKDIFPDAAALHFDSARRAVANLALLKDNIGTEGEQTFEDGMISCEVLQLGFYALHDDSVRDEYTKIAEEIFLKHRCLEQSVVPDARMRGATLRFWETMYDVLINKNMLNSPHGWSSWKTYATYYLYLLTGKYEYLTDTMDTLGACLQCVDLDTGRLRWAFAVDPSVDCEQFVPCRYGGKLERAHISEQYIDMVSYWWVPDGDTVVRGYAMPDTGLVDGPFKGGSCDNDVHEHFKCLAEVALYNAFAHELPEGFSLFSCTAKCDGGVYDFETDASFLYIYSLCDRHVTVCGKSHTVHKGLNKITVK